MNINCFIILKSLHTLICHYDKKQKSSLRPIISRRINHHGSERTVSETTDAPATREAFVEENNDEDYEDDNNPSKVLHTLKFIGNIF